MLRLKILFPRKNAVKRDFSVLLDFKLEGLRVEGGAGECSEGKKVLGQTLVPRHLEPQRVKAKAA